MRAIAVPLKLIILRSSDSHFFCTIDRENDDLESLLETSIYLYMYFIVAFAKPVASTASHLHSRYFVRHTMNERIRST